MNERTQQLFDDAREMFLMATTDYFMIRLGDSNKAMCYQLDNEIWYNENDETTEVVEIVEDIELDQAA